MNQTPTNATSRCYEALILNHVAVLCALNCQFRHRFRNCQDKKIGQDQPRLHKVSPVRCVEPDILWEKTLREVDYQLLTGGDLHGAFHAGFP